jgi:hypothetical protein
MGAFDRNNYDRDLGSRGNPQWGAGNGAGWAGQAENSVRRGWDRMTHGSSDTFSGGYDRDYGYRGMSGGGGNGYSNQGGGWADRAEGSLQRGWNRMKNTGRDAMDMGGYDRDYGYRGQQGGSWGTGYEGGAGMGMGGGYDRDYGAMGGGMDRGMQGGGYGGYDRGMKSREQTNNGDPFGDRQNRTPIRMIRGGFRGGQGDMGRGDMDRGMMAGGMGGYDRQYNGGVGDEPYYNADDYRGGQNMRGGYDQGYRGNNRDWF